MKIEELYENGNDKLKPKLNFVKNAFPFNEIRKNQPNILLKEVKGFTEKKLNFDYSKIKQMNLTPEKRSCLSIENGLINRNRNENSVFSNTGKNINNDYKGLLRSYFILDKEKNTDKNLQEKEKESKNIDNNNKYQTEDLYYYHLKDYYINLIKLENFITSYPSPHNITFHIDKIREILHNQKSGKEKVEIESNRIIQSKLKGILIEKIERSSAKIDEKMELLDTQNNGIMAQEQLLLEKVSKIEKILINFTDRKAFQDLESFNSKLLSDLNLILSKTHEIENSVYNLRCDNHFYNLNFKKDNKESILNQATDNDVNFMKNKDSQNYIQLTKIYPFLEIIDTDISANKTFRTIWNEIEVKAQEINSFFKSFTELNKIPLSSKIENINNQNNLSKRDYNFLKTQSENQTRLLNNYCFSCQSKKKLKTRCKNLLERNVLNSEINQKTCMDNSFQDDCLQPESISPSIINCNEDKFRINNFVRNSQSNHISGKVINNANKGLNLNSLITAKQLFENFNETNFKVDEGIQVETTYTFYNFKEVEGIETFKNSENKNEKAFNDLLKDENMNHNIQTKRSGLKENKIAHYNSISLCKSNLFFSEKNKKIDSTNVFRNIEEENTENSKFDLQQKIQEEFVNKNRESFGYDNSNVNNVKENVKANHISQEIFEYTNNVENENLVNLLEKLEYNQFPNKRAIKEIKFKIPKKAENIDNFIKSNEIPEESLNVIAIQNKKQKDYKTSRNFSSETNNLRSEEINSKDMNQNSNLTIENQCQDQSEKVENKNSSKSIINDGCNPLDQDSVKINNKGDPILFNKIKTPTNNNSYQFHLNCPIHIFLNKNRIRYEADNLEVNSCNIDHEFDLVKEFKPKNQESKNDVIIKEKRYDSNSLKIYKFNKCYNFSSLPNQFNYNGKLENTIPDKNSSKYCDYCLGVTLFYESKGLVKLSVMNKKMSMFGNTKMNQENIYSNFNQFKKNKEPNPCSEIIFFNTIQNQQKFENLQQINLINNNNNSSKIYSNQGKTILNIEKCIDLKNSNRNNSSSNYSEHFNPILPLKANAINISTPEHESSLEGEINEIDSKNKNINLFNKNYEKKFKNKIELNLKKKKYRTTKLKSIPINRYLRVSTPTTHYNSCKRQREGISGNMIQEQKFLSKYKEDNPFFPPNGGIVSDASVNALENHFYNQIIPSPIFKQRDNTFIKTIPTMKIDEIKSKQDQSCTINKGNDARIHIVNGLECCDKVPNNNESIIKISLNSQEQLKEKKHNNLINSSKTRMKFSNQTSKNENSNILGINVNNTKSKVLSEEKCQIILKENHVRWTDDKLFILQIVNNILKIGETNVDKINEIPKVQEKSFALNTKEQLNNHNEGFYKTFSQEKISDEFFNNVVQADPFHDYIRIIHQNMDKNCS